MKKIKINKARCKKCGDIIVSRFCHDFKQCNCKNIFVDGGRQYLRRGADDLDDIEELSEYFEDVIDEKTSTV